MKRAALILFMAAMAATPGCTAAADDAIGQDEAAQSKVAVDPRAALAGQEWARCWFATSANDADTFDFVCKRTATPGYPWGVGNTYVSPLAIASRDFLGGSGNMGPLTKVDQDREVVKATGIRRTEFPLRVHSRVDVYSFADTREYYPPSMTYGDLEGDQRILDPQAATAANPVIIKQPFDLWPLRIVTLGERGYELHVPAYEFSTGPMTVRARGDEPLNGGSVMEAWLDELIAFDGTTNVFLPPPMAGTISATIAPRTVGIREPVG
ncbi:MAG TPA: hypothetical protein VM925_00645, partial [Labilithrix sp.]|nr:hypothetical protein [Labilithrix sp.]